MTGSGVLRSLWVAALVVHGLSAQARAAGSAWSRFRGPGGLGVSVEAELPVTWGKEENLLWKAALPGPGASSPIVVGERVFVTCYSGYGVRGQRGGTLKDLKRHILCLHLADGRTLWQKDIVASQPEQPCEGARIGGHGSASSTPAADSDRLYVFFGKTGVFAFSHEGRQLWRADVGSGIHVWGSATSPVLYKNLVIVNACVESGSLVALSRESGKDVWRAEGVKESWSTPCLVDAPGGKTELVIGADWRMLGFDADSGTPLWTCRGAPSYMCSTAVGHQGIAYALCRDQTLAIRAGGRGDVTQSHRVWKVGRGATVPSPVCHEGHLYFATDGGTAVCLNAKTGEVAYRAELRSPGGEMYPSPVLADGKLYYVSQGGRTFVLAAKPTFELLAQNDLGDGSLFNASPAVAGGRLLLRSDRFLYCIGKRQQASGRASEGARKELPRRSEAGTNQAGATAERRTM